MTYLTSETTSKWYLHDGEGKPLEISRAFAVELLSVTMGESAEVYVDVMHMRSVSTGHMILRS